MKISSAYDAFWFLTEHPKFKCREATMLSAEEAKTWTKKKGYRIRRVKDQMPWNKNTYLLLEHPLQREAMTSNLDIHYAKVDKSGRVNDDDSVNVFIECWLEFGPIKQTVSDGILHVSNFHDINLDCGAPTFDQALVKLARLVRKHYGDMKTPRWIDSRKQL